MHVFVCSVGGSPEPVIKSINAHHPEKIIYVASSESRKLIRTGIEARLTWQGIVDTSIITLSDFQNLLTCVRDIRQGINQAWQELDLPEDTVLTADITGGTKIMSAALTLVMMEYPSRFAYVGGQTRTKNGMGVVEEGHETIIKLDNPWDVMVVRESQRLVRSFNAGLYLAALDCAKQLGDNLGDKGPFYHCLADVAQAYAQWDSFDHASAQKKMQQALGRLKPYALQSPPLAQLEQRLKENKAVLDAVCADAAHLRAATKKLPPDCGQWYLRDLVANARRCAAQGRYDDAVARLYSAIEKSAKIRLNAAYGIDNSHVELDRVPAAARQGLQERAGEGEDIRIGLTQSFSLLRELDDPLGEAYTACAVELGKNLQIRNMSLLAHGYNPVDTKAYEKLYTIALHFLGIEEDALPQFITLHWDAMPL